MLDTARNLLLKELSLGNQPRRIVIRRRSSRDFGSLILGIQVHPEAARRAAKTLKSTCVSMKKPGFLSWLFIWVLVP